jgi:3',5'-cyclic AMP phosphodiesterase CpdA
VKTSLLLAAALVPASAHAARFAVYGDTRDSDAEHARVVGHIVAARPDLALFTGDAVKDGLQAAEWDVFFATEKPLADRAPIYYVPGNHDVGPLFMARVREPPVGALGTAEAFSFDALGVHFVGLNTETHIGAGSGAYQFVQKDLEAHAGQPIVVFMHRPLYSSGGHGGDAALKSAYEPLFVKAGVLAVFQGHDHDYERTAPIEGVTYFVEGGGGALPRGFEGAAPAWSAFRLSTYGYALVDVLADRLEVSAFDGNGTVIDHVGLPLKAAAVPAPGPAAPAPAPAAPRPALAPAPPARPAPRPDTSGDLAVVGIAAAVGLLGTGLYLTARQRQGRGP